MAKTSLIKMGDLVVELNNRAFSCVSAKVKNPELTTVSVADPVGYPLNLNSGSYELLKATQEASCDSIILAGPAIVDLATTASTPDLYLILVRGPAVLNETKIAAKDHAGTAFTLATLKTALNGLSPAVYTVAEPTKTTTQTT